jgi:hypothetical protein
MSAPFNQLTPAQAMSAPLLAISIRQPWPWAIINAGKDIENRSWPTKVRGRVLIHASLKTDDDEFAACLDLLDEIQPIGLAGKYGRRASAVHSKDARRGGIVGSVEIVDCVQRSDSPWFFGPYGFVLRDPRPVPFMPCKGKLGFFRPEIEVSP